MIDFSVKPFGWVKMIRNPPADRKRQRRRRRELCAYSSAGREVVVRSTAFPNDRRRDEFSRKDDDVSFCTVFHERKSPSVGVGEKDGRSVFFFHWKAKKKTAAANVYENFRGFHRASTTYPTVIYVRAITVAVACTRALEIFFLVDRHFRTSLYLLVRLKKKKLNPAGLYFPLFYDQR